MWKGRYEPYQPWSILMSGGFGAKVKRSQVPWIVLALNFFNIWSCFANVSHASTFMRYLLLQMFHMQAPSWDTLFCKCFTCEHLHEIPCFANVSHASTFMRYINLQMFHMRAPSWDTLFCKCFTCEHLHEIPCFANVSHASTFMRYLVLQMFHMWAPSWDDLESNSCRCLATRLRSQHGPKLICSILSCLWAR